MVRKGLEHNIIEEGGGHEMFLYSAFDDLCRSGGQLTFCQIDFYLGILGRTISRSSSALFPPVLPILPIKR